jgi:hypothetical protein
LLLITPEWVLKFEVFQAWVTDVLYIGWSQDQLTYTVCFVVCASGVDLDISAIEVP